MEIEFENLFPQERDRAFLSAYKALHSQDFSRIDLIERQVGIWYGALCGGDMQVQISPVWTVAWATSLSFRVRIGWVIDDVWVAMEC